MKFLKYCLLITVVFVIVNAFLFLTKLDIGKLNDNDFLFGFIGVLLGISYALFPFILQIISNSIQKLDEKLKNDEDQKEELSKILKKVHSELKENLSFVFLSMIIISLLYLFQNVSLPYYDWVLISFFEKSLVLKSIRLTIFGLNIYAIYDLIQASFVLSETNTKI